LGGVVKGGPPACPNRRVCSEGVTRSAGHI